MVGILKAFSPTISFGTSFNDWSKKLLVSSSVQTGTQHIQDRYPQVILNKPVELKLILENKIVSKNEIIQTAKAVI